MSHEKIEPHKIKSPIQLMAVWFLALIILCALLLTAARLIERPEWIVSALVLAAIALIPVFIIAIFLMQTLFRGHLLDDDHFSEWDKMRRKIFIGLKPEVKDRVIGEECNTMRVLDIEKKSEEILVSQRGLFLAHMWEEKEEKTDGETWYEVAIWLTRSQIDLVSRDMVDRVEYHFSPVITDGPGIKKNARDSFRINILLHRPVLCVAKVYFFSGIPPIEISRYVDLGYQE